MSQPNRDDERKHPEQVHNGIDENSILGQRIREKQSLKPRTQDDDVAVEATDSHQDVVDAVDRATNREQTQDHDQDQSQEEDEDRGESINARPYIHISPAREQVTPGSVVNGLFGLYRAGVTETSRFNLKDRLGLVDNDVGFEFIVHKPRNTKRFDFYLSVTPYEPTAFKNLAASVRAMYPEPFEFEVVPFNPVAAFATDSGDARVGASRLGALEGSSDFQNIQGFENSTDNAGSSERFSPVEADVQLEANGIPLRPEEVPDERKPTLVRWNGVPLKKNDWMTLIHPFTDVAVDIDDQYRSPLSVLLEQAVHSTDPFLFQAIFRPRDDWSRDAESHKRNLKMGNHGTLSAFKNEFLRQAFGTSDEERRNMHRGDISEQVGGSATPGDGNKIGGSRMSQIDHKQPTTTFDVTLRAAGDEATTQSIESAFTSLSGPYYGIEGDILGNDDEEFHRLCHGELAPSGGLKGRFKKTSPRLVASPDELANFVVVPHTDALPRASRGASGGSPDARSPLTATDEDLLSRYDHGMHIGYAETAVDNRPDIPIKLSAEQLTHHILRAATTGGGKTTSMINDALSAHESFDGPTFIFDKKGGSMSTEYKKAHFEKFGNLDDVLHVPVPGPNDEVLAFPYFDIRPQLAAGVSRTVAVQEKIDRYNELLVFVLGSEMVEQAFVAQEILNALIRAKFDPEHGSDAFAIEDLFEAAQVMQSGTPPDVSDDTLHDVLARHLKADEQRFQTSIDAVMNRITKLAERSFIWRVLNFVPEWDEENQCYANQAPMFDIHDILDSKKVVLIDTGDLRPASSNLFTFMLLDYIWSGARLRHRQGQMPGPDDGYVINLIIDEAAPMLQSDLVRDDMIPDGREFGLSLEVIVHFAEQVKTDALDVASYKEILRNINTKLIGKLAVDEELIMTLFHEGIEDEELIDRVTSLPRGEWIAQLPDTGFMTDIPELVTLLPVEIPAGHSDSDNPVTGDSVSILGVPFSEADHEMVRVTRDDYCLLPGSNTSDSGEQRATANATPRQQPSASSTASTSSANRHQATSTRDGGVEFGGDGRFMDDHVDDASPSRRTPAEPSSTSADQGASDDTQAAGMQLAPSGESTTTGTTKGGDRLSDEASSQSADDADKNSSSWGETNDGLGDQQLPDRIDENLTIEEWQFLNDVVVTINGDHPEFDLLDSMKPIKNQYSDIDVEKLKDLGFLEEQMENLRLYYYVTRDGQDACGRTIVTGEDQGDVNEKTYHKVMVEALARTIDQETNGKYLIKKYSPLFGTEATPDMIAYDDLRPAIIGEVVANVDHADIVKHYDDFSQFNPDRKIWVVPNLSGAWDIAKALANAGRIEELPAKRRGKSHAELTETIWGTDGDWEFASASKLVNDLE